jgi:hypothetical protein
MTSFLKRAGAILALTATSIAVPAQAACWNDAAISAAKVRDLETMLMVSTLRCRLSGQNMLSAYNQMINKSRSALTAVNDSLRAHFIADVGERAGLNAYDRYVTSVANRYGAGVEGLNCRDMASILAAANAEGGSAKGLARLANDAGVEPRLSGGRCSIAMAKR